MAHRTVPVKVTAWIDEGVAPLVRALNEFPHVVTLDSCEDSFDDGRAYVLFTCEGEDPAEFGRELGKALSRESLDYTLRAEWRPEQREPLLELACPADQIGDLAEAVTAFQTMRSDGDRHGTALRS